MKSSQNKLTLNNSKKLLTLSDSQIYSRLTNNIFVLPPEYSIKMEINETNNYLLDLHLKLLWTKLKHHESVLDHVQYNPNEGNLVIDYMFVKGKKVEFYSIFVYYLLLWF